MEREARQAETLRVKKPPRPGVHWAPNVGDAEDPGRVMQTKSPSAARHIGPLPMARARIQESKSRFAQSKNVLFGPAAPTARRAAANIVPAKNKSKWCVLRARTGDSRRCQRCVLCPEATILATIRYRNFQIADSDSGSAAFLSSRTMSEWSRTCVRSAHRGIKAHFRFLASCRSRS